MCAVLSHFSHVLIFATLWTVTRQAPLSMGFSRQGYWNGLPCPPPGDFPELGVELVSLMSTALAGWFFYHLHHLGNPGLALLAINSYFDHHLTSESASELIQQKDVTNKPPWILAVSSTSPKRPVWLWFFAFPQKPCCEVALQSTCCRFISPACSQASWFWLREMTVGY